MRETDYDTVLKFRHKFNLNTRQMAAFCDLPAGQIWQIEWGDGWLDNYTRDCLKRLLAGPPGMDADYLARSGAWKNVPVAGRFQMKTLTREYLSWRWKDGLSREEAAEQLGMSVQTYVTTERTGSVRLPEEFRAAMYRDRMRFPLLWRG